VSRLRSSLLRGPRGFVRKILTKKKLDSGAMENEEEEEEEGK
jgi:hypothetical protein